MKLNSFLLVGLLPLLFLGNVANQLYNVHTHGLSPWRGGGFGMFASVDTHTRRRLRVIGMDADGKTYRITFTATAFKSQWIDRDRIRGLSIYPHHKRLESFAEELLKRQFVPSGEFEKYYLQKIKRKNHPIFKNLHAASLDAEKLPFLRPLKPKEESSEVVELVSIKISVWGIGFDQNSGTDFWEQKGEMIHVKK